MQSMLRLGMGWDSDEQRLWRVKTLQLVFMGMCGLGSLLYLITFLLSGYMGVLAEAGFLALGCGFAYVAGRFVQQEQVDKAAYCLLGTIVISYGGAILVWQGITGHLAMGGALLILMVGGVTFKRQWNMLFTVTVLFSGYLWLVEQFNLPRFDVLGKNWLIQFYLSSMTLVVLIAVILLVVRSVQIRTLQTRLLIVLILVALGPVLVSTSVAMWVGFNNGQETAFANLSTVETFKMGQIKGLLDQLTLNLRLELTEPDVQRHIQTLLDGTPDSPEYQDAYSRLREHFIQMTMEDASYNDVFLISPQGKVLVSNDLTLEGRAIPELANLGTRVLENPVRPPFYSSIWNENVLLSTAPVFDKEGHIWGLLAARTSVQQKLEKILSQDTGLGKTGESYLVDGRGALLTPLKTPGFVVVGKVVDTEGVDQGWNQVGGAKPGLYINYAGVPVVGIYRPIEGLETMLVIEQAREETLEQVRNTVSLNIGVALGALALAIVLSILLTRSITQPLVSLVQTVDQISAGDLDRRVTVLREDEIGALGRAFNVMTAQLKELIGSLENRVTERTRELENRSMQLEVAARVIRDTSTIRDLRQMLNATVRLIAERRGFYHVGIFLLDDSGEYAVLQAASSAGGQRMLSRGYRRRIGEGLIGQVVRSGEAKLVSNFEEEAIFRSNPELPESRSEVSLPLRVRDRVIGVLDVHELKGGAFAHDDVAILQILADLVALAIENVRLLGETQRSLQEREMLYGQRVQEAWRRRLLQQQDTFLYTGLAVEPAAPVLVPQVDQIQEEGHPVLVATENGRRLLAPIRLRGKQIATLVLDQSSDQVSWGTEELTLVEEVTTQIAVALENARLLEETRMRAAREQLVGEVAARVRTSTEVDTILRTAIKELGVVLGAAGGVIRLEAAGLDTNFSMDDFPEIRDDAPQA